MTSYSSVMSSLPLFFTIAPSVIKCLNVNTYINYQNTQCKAMNLINYRLCWLCHEVILVKHVDCCIIEVYLGRKQLNIYEDYLDKTSLKDEKWILRYLTKLKRMYGQVNKASVRSRKYKGKSFVLTNIEVKNTGPVLADTQSWL